MQNYDLYKILNLDFNSLNICNNTNNIETVNDIYNDYYIDSIYNFNNKEDDYPNFNGNKLNPSLEEKSTGIKTLFSNNKSNYNFVHFKDLTCFFKENKKFSQIYEKFIKNKKTEYIENKLNSKKRKRDPNPDIENNEPWVNYEKKNESKEKVKRGRKIRKDNPSKIEHNKFSEDNIIRKIKDKLFLYKLNYKLIIQIKKEKDLEYLNMSLKDLYSFDISPKYKKIDKKHNKNIIKQIVEKTILVEDYPTVMFVFELNIRNWMELFTYKKSINEIIKEYNGY